MKYLLLCAILFAGCEAPEQDGRIQANYHPEHWRLVPIDRGLPRTVPCPLCGKDSYLTGIWSVTLDYNCGQHWTELDRDNLKLIRCIEHKHVLKVEQEAKQLCRCKLDRNCIQQAAKILGIRLEGAQRC